MSFEEIFRIQVGIQPHAIATTPDGRWVYVPCRDGHYWIVDTQTRKVVKRLRTGGRPHNTSISADGRFAFLSPMGDPERATIVDIRAGHKVIGEIPFSDSIRPPALSADAAWLFQHVDGLNGFEVADVVKRRVIASVEHTTALPGIFVHGKFGWLSFDGFQRCHGLGLRPDQEEIWSVCGEAVTVHEARSPFREVTRIPLKNDAYWIAFSPDSRYALIPIRAERLVAMVDTAQKKVVAHFAVGDSPKRNLVIIAPPPTQERAASQPADVSSSD